MCCYQPVLGSIVVSIPACHAGDRGSIPRRGGQFFRMPPSFMNWRLVFASSSTCVCPLWACRTLSRLEYCKRKCRCFLWLFLLCYWRCGQAVRRLSRKQEIVGSNPTSAFLWGYFHLKVQYDMIRKAKHAFPLFIELWLWIQMFPPGLEPGTLRVWSARDNHYTTETTLTDLDFPQ